MEENNMNERKKSCNNLLIVLVIVLSLALLGLSYYEFFAKEKCININEKSGNNSVDKIDNSNIYQKYLTNLKESIKNTYTDYNYDLRNYSNTMLNIQYNLSVTKNFELYLNEEKIADNVLNYFVVENGNGGCKTLYYLTGDGNLYEVSHETYLYEQEKELKVIRTERKNIVNITSGGVSNDGHGGHGGSIQPIFIDINGNLSY